MKLLGVKLDKDLNFSKHIPDIVRKVGNQIQVLQRHKNLIDVNIKFRLYNAYLLPHLTYYSIIWHYCGQRNSEKLEKLHQRTLRFIYNDRESTYEELLSCINHLILFNRKIHDILILIYKALRGLSPEYISKLFTFRNCNKDLRGIDILSVPRVNTTRFGLHSVSYHGCKLWNSRLNNIRAIPDISKFKLAISDLKFDADCCTFCG